MHRDKVQTDSEWSIEDSGMWNARLGHAKRASGLDPYQGVMSAKQPSRKRDLRKVEEWLKAKRRGEQLKREALDD